VQYLNIWDLVLTPLYLLVLTFLARRHRDRKYRPGNPLRPYYLRGLYIKFAGAIFIALIYQYYYHGGDTYNYFTHSQIINSSTHDSFSTWFQLIFRVSPDDNPRLYAYSSQMEWYNDTSSYTVAAIGAVLGLLNGTTYMPMALLFAYIAYSGIWAMFRTFVQIYPKLHKQLAIAFLFIPSTIVWGSAVFKDTVCMFGLGWLTYCTFNIFLNKDFSVRNILMLSMSFYLIAVIKLYILIAFIPALSLWLLMSYSHKIKTWALRFLVNIMFIATTVGGFFFFANRYSKELDKYSLDNVVKTADITRNWIVFSSGDEGSSYDLGEMDGSLGSMLLKFPAGVAVTLFRPFPWEIKKVIVGLSALEAMAFLFFTAKIFFTRGIPLKLVFKDPNVVFFLLFSLIFAFAVGITSYNFGALSRYKIPCLPFYGAFIMIALNYKKSPATDEIAVKKKRRLPEYYTGQ
jgi:hypothetical protein